MKTIGLDAMTHQEIKDIINNCYTAVAVIEFAYDGYYPPVLELITSETEISEVKAAMLSHKEAVNNEPLYTIFKLEGGEVKEIHAFDAEKWVDETLPVVLEEFDFEGSDLLDPDQGNDNLY